MNSVEFATEKQSNSRADGVVNFQLKRLVIKLLSYGGIKNESK